MKLPSKFRPPDERELRYLRTQRAALARRRAAWWKRGLVAGGIVFGGLAGLTLLAEPAHPAIVLGFWTVTGAAIGLWSYVSERRQIGRRMAGYDHALAAGVCADLSIKAKRMWAFEEQEDEGAGYAFELESGGVVFVMGQEYYSGARFPNTDFPLVEFHDGAGMVVDLLTTKRGVKITPERIISASEQKGRSIPEHADYFEGTLEEAMAKLGVV